MIKYLSSFKKREDGVAAIEFAIFAIPFFLLIMGIIEIGIMFGAATVLNGATEDAARLIRTGQAQNSGDAEKDFAEELCNQIKAFVDCDDLKYTVVKLDTDDDFVTAYGDPSIVPPVVNPVDPKELSASTFDAGEQNDRIIVRVAYDYQLMTPLAAPFFSDRPNNKRLLISTAVIQNEPY